jgi:hypothetical protein
MTNYINTPTISQFGFHQEGFVTPSNKISPGVDSTGKFRPAPYLPLLRYDQEKFTYVVVSSGKPVAFIDNFLVPAGYKLEIDAVTAGGTATILYTALDVQQGVRNYAGTLVTVGEGVVTSIIAASAKASYFVGFAEYDYFRHGGGDGINPSQFNRTNFNPQFAVAYNMDYNYEYPVVKDNTAYSAAPYVGIAAFIGTGIKPGQFVTYDVNSNFVITNTDFSRGTVPYEAICGQVNAVYIVKDSTSGAVLNPVNSLDTVVTPQNIAGTPLNQLAGLENGGVPQKITYANGYGYVRFGLNTR